MAAGLAAALAAGGCGSDDDGAAPQEVTSTAPVATGPTTSTTTTAPAMTTTITTSTGAAPTTTATPVDSTPPAAPTNVTCAAGGGSGEVRLEWDAPSDADGVTDIRVYVDDGGGFVRLTKITTDAEALEIGGTSWATVVYPIWPRTPVQVAVTHGDAAGNESGWNPIEVDYDYVPSEYPGTCG